METGQRVASAAVVDFDSSPSRGEAIVDLALELTFPASDPIAIHDAFVLRTRAEAEPSIVSKLDRNTA